MLTEKERNKECQTCPLMRKDRFFDSDASLEIDRLGAKNDRLREELERLKERFNVR